MANHLTETGSAYGAKVLPILSGEYAYKTPRPHYSVLDKSKIKKTFGIDIPYWTEALYRCLLKML